MKTSADAGLEAFLASAKRHMEEMDRILAAGPYPCVECGVTTVPMPRDTCSKCVEIEKRKKRLSEARSTRLRRLPRWPASFLAHHDGPKPAPDGRSLQTICGAQAVEEAHKALEALLSCPTQKSALVLQGDTGVGKTTLAVDLTVTAEIGGHRTFWAAAREVGTCRRDSGLGHEPAVLSDAKSARLLVLDDLGQEDMLGRDVVRELVHAGYDAALPLIVTTGFDRLWIANTYGAQFERRIFENGVTLKMRKRH